MDVSEEEHTMMGRSMRDMMSPRYDATDSEVDNFQVTDGSTVIGQINITRYSSLDDSVVAREFKTSLLVNSLYSIAIVLILAIFTGVFISRKMSGDLTNTARMANNISMAKRRRIQIAI